MRTFSDLQKALVAALVCAACDGAQSGRPVVHPPARIEQLWAPPGATLLDPPDEPTPSGARAVSFRISVRNADDLTNQLRDQVERGEWHARYSPAFVAASFMDGWTKVGPGVRVPPQTGVSRIVEVREWAGDWDNRAGDRLEYRLMAVRQEGKTHTEVTAYGRYVPAAAIRR